MGAGAGAGCAAGAGCTTGATYAATTGMAAWQPRVHCGAGPKPLCQQRPELLVTAAPRESVTSAFSFGSLTWAPAVAERTPSARAQAAARMVCLLVKVFFMMFSR